MKFQLDSLTIYIHFSYMLDVCKKVVKSLILVLHETE